MSFSLPNYSQHQYIKIPFESLTTKDGLLSNEVKSIVKDSMGFYWYATSVGLIRDDGTSLEIFRHSRENIFTIPDDDVASLLVVNNEIVAGLTQKGQIFLYDYRDQEYNRIFRISIPTHAGTKNTTRAMTSDGKSLFTIDNLGDVYQIDLHTYTAALYYTSGQRLMDDPYVAVFHSDRIWIGTENGLFNIDTSTCIATRMNLFHYAKGEDGLLSVRVIEPYTDHTFILSSHRSSKHPFKGLILFNGQDFSNEPLCLSAMNKNFDDYPIDIVKKIQGSTFFIRIHSLTRFLYNIETHTWDTLTVDANNSRLLNSSSFNCVTADVGGRFLVGTNQGIFIHEPTSYLFEEFYPQNGNFFARQWTGLFMNDKNKLYVGTEKAIKCFDPALDSVTSEIRIPYIKPHHRQNHQPALIALDSNRLLVLSSLVYTYDIRKNTFTLIETDTSSPNKSPIRSNLFPYTMRGSVCYFVRDGILFSLDLTDFTLRQIPIVQNENDTLYLNASGMTFDHQGFLWVTSYNAGLVRIDVQKGKAISHLLYHSECVLNDIITDRDHDTLLWVASTGCGLIKININDITDLQSRCFEVPDGYITSDLHQIMEDDYGRIWSSSQYGINYFVKETESVFNFNKSHGIEFPHNFFRGKTMDQLGNFYFSGGINIVKIDPHNFVKKTLPPAVYIKQFKINQNPKCAFWNDTSITLKDRENNFSFEISAINHTHSSLNKYKYMLENFNDDWISTTQRNLTIPFNNLKPGRYTFKAIASNQEGVWNTKGIQIAIQILPPIRNTWWVRSILVVMLVFITYYIIRQHTQRLLALQRIEIEKKIALEAERSRISRDMHDDLGSGLSAIHLLSEYLQESSLEKYPEFSAEIEKIRSSSEELNRAIREIIWTVNSKDDTLQSLVQFIQRYGHEMHEKTRIPIHVHVPDPIPNIPLNGVQRKNLYLCLKECVNNAIKHANPTSVDVFINTDQDTTITLLIKDDGKGIANAGRNWTGNGLTNMKDRISDLGGTMEIESGESGTEVRFVCKV